MSELDTVSLIADLRTICDKLREDFSFSTGALNRVLYALAHPNVPELRHDLPYRIEQWTDDGDSLLRTVSASGNLEIAAGAWNATVTSNPRYRWLLRQGAQVLRDHEPDRIS